jgi:hypothetical protein
LRVGTVEHVANHSVLAAGVHGLENHEHLVLPLGVEDFLQRFETTVELLGPGLACRLATVKGCGIPWI